MKTDWLTLGANCAQIASIPLTIVLWYFTRDRFTAFWSKWKWVFIAFILIVAGLGLWRLGWLHWLLIEVTWPVWSLFVLFIAGPLIAALLLLLFAAYKRNAIQTHHADNVFGVEWQWEGNVHNANLVPICPDSSCSGVLEVRLHRVLCPDVQLFCRNCKFKSEVFDCDFETLRQRVFLEIDRRMRIGQFKDKGAKPKG